MRTRLCVVLALLAAGGLPDSGLTRARAQPPAPDGAASAPTGEQPTATPPAEDDAPLAGPGRLVSRADLARAYLRFEAALRDHPAATPERIKATNQDFDAATMMFFGGNFAGAIERLNEAIARIENDGEDQRTPERRRAESIRAQVEPRVYRAGEAPPAVSVGSLYSAAPAQATGATPADPADAAKPWAAWVELLETSGEVVGTPLGPILPSPRGTYSATFTADAWKPLAPGRYRLAVRVGEGASAHRHDTGTLTVIDTDWAELREAYRRAVIPVFRERGADLGPAVEVFRSRVALLTAKPSNANSAHFLLDAPALIRELNSERDALIAGTDPYSRRAGDYWRTIRIAGRDVPARVFAPAAACGPDAPPVPLVIALHGAGGDESMFMDGYGAGEIKRLAERHGFVVVSPLTTMVGSNIAHFDALLEAAAAAYPVDRDRVYVVGHSMGAGVAAMIAQVRADRLAGVVCIAGGPRGRLEAQPAPMLVFAGEFDPLFPARRMREQATQAAKDGRRVEFREAKGNGHTLIVGAKLAEAVEWMLARKLEPPPAPPAPKDEMMAPPEGSPKG